MMRIMPPQVGQGYTSNSGISSLMKEALIASAFDLMAGLCHDSDIPKKQPINVKVLGLKGKWITSTGKTVADATAKAIQKKARAAGKS
jgi:hypothetical protein